MSNLTRRQVLGAVAAGGAVGIAGCSGGDGNGGGDGGLSAAFESVEIDGDELVVQLAGDATSTVNVIGPEGTPSLGSASVATGASQVSFNLLTDYEPGEHEIVAVDSGDNQIGSTTQRLNPQPEIEEVVTYDMQQDVGWPTGYWMDGHALVTISNTGNAPIRLFYTLWQEVPNPTPKLDELKTNGNVTGLIDKDGDAITKIPTGGSITGLATSLPFEFARTDFDCSISHDTKLTVGYQGESVIDIPINYTADGGECQAVVQS
jgi:hypothetical protein